MNYMSNKIFDIIKEVMLYIYIYLHIRHKHVEPLQRQPHPSQPEQPSTIRAPEEMLRHFSPQLATH